MDQQCKTHRAMIEIESKNRDETLELRSNNCENDHVKSTVQYIMCAQNRLFFIFVSQLLKILNAIFVFTQKALKELIKDNAKLIA